MICERRSGPPSAWRSGSVRGGGNPTRSIHLRMDNLSIHTEDYERFGSIYWWDGLIRDAGFEMVVSDEIMVEGGPTIRKFIRAEMRRHLEGLAAGKELGRIIWRIVSRDPFRFQTTIRALVGPRAVDYGLGVRADRRAGRT